MKIKGIIKYAVSILYRKKRLFVLELFMMALSVCLLNQAFIRYYNVNHSIIALKDNIDTPISETYKITFGNIANISKENGKKIYDFMNKLKSVKGIKLAGKYYVEGVGLSGAEDKTIQIGNDTLLIDAELMGLHNVRNIDNKGIILSDGDYTALAVGSNLAELMPIGSKWQDVYYDKKYIVTDIIKKGETWMTTSIIDEGKHELCLDDMMLTISNDKSFELDEYYTSFTFASNVFFTVDSKNADTVLDDIKQSAVDMECPVYINSVGELIDNYKEEYSEVYGQTNFQVIMVMIMTFIGLLMTMIIALNLQSENMKVMHIFGVSVREHIIIHIINQGIMMALAYSIGCFVSFVLTGRWYQNDINYLSRVIPYSMAAFILVYIIVEINAVRIIRYTLNKGTRRGD